MARQKIIKKGSATHYQGLSINATYSLNEHSLKELENTLRYALSTYRTVTAVRLDFSIKKASQDECLEASSEDIQGCFQTFLNRIHKLLELDMCMNWKLERSNKKGLHIHTVFYFNYSQVKTFTAQGKLFLDLRSEWRRITGEQGNINICSSGLSDTKEKFQVKGNRQYTILGNIPKDQTDKNYHQQKNQLTEKAGFFHWISYLAKTEQQATDKRKRCGARTYKTTETALSAAPTPTRKGMILVAF